VQWKGSECLLLSLSPLQEIKIYSYATVEGDGDDDNDNNNNYYYYYYKNNILKYKDLLIEIKRKWNVKAKVIPVIIGTTGTISKLISQCLSNIPVKHEIKKLPPPPQKPYWALHIYYGKCKM
jgi:hypothetical protein